MKKHRQIFYLIRNFDLKSVEDKSHALFKSLFNRLQEKGFISHSKNHILHENSMIGLIDLDLKTFEVSDTITNGYMFATHFPDKTLLLLETVVDNFDALIIQEDSALLDSLYRQAKIAKDQREGN
jgi:hypothetical protein